MRRTKRFGSKKVTLSTILTVLALCGSLSVSAADTLNLTTGTTHNNAVTNNSNTENDTVAIGFNNSADNGAITIGSHNRAGNANDTDIVVAVGGKNYANNGSVVVGYSNTGKSGSTVIGQNSFGSAWASVLGNNARSAGSIAIGNKASSGYFNVSSQFDNQRDTAFSVAIGNSSTALGGTSVGYDSISDHDGVALGASANAQYGGTALGTGAETSRNTYSSTRGNGVALGEYSYADRRYGTYGYVPLSDTTASVSTPDSMENDIALANKTGDTSVISAVKNFYQKYDNDTYTQWKNLDAKHEEALLTYDEKVAEMNSKTYASSADRASDYAILQNLEKSLTDTSNALKDFENEHSGIAAAALRKDSALSTYKATASAVSLGYGDTSSDQAMTRQITNLAAGTADTDAVNVAQLKQVATIADNHTAITVDSNTPTAGDDGALGDYVGDNNLTMAVKDVDGQKTYDLKLSNNLVIGEKGTDGTDGTDGTAGSIGIVGPKGEDGKNAYADISVKDGADGLDGESLTRIVYTDENKQEHQVATLDDGLKFTGDAKDVTVAKKLNETLPITGGADMTRLSNNNIGVVADKDNGLTVKLAKDITLSDGNITLIGAKDADGNTLVQGQDGKWYSDLSDATYDASTGAYKKADGSTVNAVDPSALSTVKLSGSGLDNGGQKITNVAAGVNDTDAVNKGQLTQAISDATASVNGKHTVITVDGTEAKAGEYVGTGNLKLGLTETDGQKTYDLKLSNNVTVGEKGADGKDGTPGTIEIIGGTPGSDGKDGTTDGSSAVISVKNGADGLDGESLTRIVYTDANGDEHQVATLDDGLKFTGDTANVTVSKKLNQTLSITGGADMTNLSNNNIGVVADAANGLTIKLAKDLNGLNSVRVGGSAEGEGIYIANQTVPNTNGSSETGNYITGLTNTTWAPTATGYVSGRAATEDQLKSVYDTISSDVKANNVVGSKNITVTKLDNGAGTQVALNDNINLGTMGGKNVSISGQYGSITAGDGNTNKVIVDGANSSITAGTGDGRVTVYGNNGLITVGNTAKGAVSIGNQSVTGTKADGMTETQSGKYITGLENTTWDPANTGVVEDRAATEGQLKNVADNISKQINDIDTAVKSTSRVFESDSGTEKQVTRKSSDPMKLKGGATGELSDGNIGVVNNSDNTGFDIKLSKDIKGLNSVTTKELNSETANITNSITVGTGDNKTVITGDSIRTGNTTINNNGLTINNSDPTKNITIQDGNIKMGGNAIHNVGEATEAGDAINKGQFDRTINNIGNGMNEMNGRINQIGRDVNRVGAGAAALASLHPLDFDPDDKGSFAVGFGSYKSEHAAALGAFYRPNEDTMVNLAATIGNNDNMYSAGVSFKIGSSSPYHNMSKSEMAVKLETQDKQLSDQNQKIETLESQNQDLNARLAKLEALVASK